jgi:arabinogalactan endo-1,4-beta-galactosidase
MLWHGLLTLAARFNAASAVPYAPSKPYFYRGHDLSSLKILEDGGAVYHDAARGNRTRAPEDILGDGGMNTVRLRYDHDAIADNIGTVS